MNLIIFGGFLGSGKTSLILSLSHFLLENKNSVKSNVVIIENEIGEIGVDDKVLEYSGLSVRELFSGCICCQLSSDLIITLNDIHEKIDPEWVIIETTGLAYPGRILSTLKEYGKNIDSIKIVTVVDGERFKELIAVTPVLITNQIADGDIILINKMDLVKEKELEQIKNHVKKLNPTAGLHMLSANTSTDKDIWKEVTGKYE
ncbi:GTP-binding protein [Clostridium sp. MT-14]|uniref:Cobalamin biosynthesis protein P47K n=1 Tax=Clostridium aromativorans TaxID=2836848 RepID=A0ABS8N7U6_9CLOT|nr:GTP-binding protein [Clostridium aromativorans]MCC9295877.1 cobalamin biosynthesis protein P47K [Clostridium aromativorans]